VEADTEIEERGKRKEERGKRKEERGKRKGFSIFRKFTKQFSKSRLY
jgi:hypothetical protein